MMPTIVACEYEGKTLPDHGEVWSIPWRLESVEGVLSFGCISETVSTDVRR